jgi:hypothetical protein
MIGKWLNVLTPLVRPRGRSGAASERRTGVIGWRRRCDGARHWLTERLRITCVGTPGADVTSTPR